MTTTQESGRHVTPERIRADGAKMVRAGFRLVYERPLAELESEYQSMRLAWHTELYGRLGRESIPGEDGRMA